MELEDRRWENQGIIDGQDHLGMKPHSKHHALKRHVGEIKITRLATNTDAFHQCSQITRLATNTDAILELMFRHKILTYPQAWVHMSLQTYFTLQLMLYNMVVNPIKVEYLWVKVQLVHYNQRDRQMSINK